ncbi:hypothetical protein C2E23DRAFT_280765 [Lenzites betulinus]|nr:hypothetical protein C2E23DRAFT_280765 [Lenzites betulinus]
MYACRVAVCVIRRAIINSLVLRRRHPVSLSSQFLLHVETVSGFWSSSPSQIFRAFREAIRVCTGGVRGRSFLSLKLGTWRRLQCSTFNSHHFRVAASFFHAMLAYSPVYIQRSLSGDCAFNRSRVAVMSSFLGVSVQSTLKVPTRSLSQWHKHAQDAQDAQDIAQDAQVQDVSPMRRAHPASTTSRTRLPHISDISSQPHRCVQGFPMRRARPAPSLSSSSRARLPRVYSPWSQLETLRGVLSVSAVVGVRCSCVSPSRDRETCKFHVGHSMWSNLGGAADFSPRQASTFPVGGGRCHLANRAPYMSICQVITSRRRVCTSARRLSNRSQRGVAQFTCRIAAWQARYQPHVQRSLSSHP